ncbi:class I SAM-dependent methyltransferase [Thermodesulfobacteriota bacterium]
MGKNIKWIPALKHVKMDLLIESVVCVPFIIMIAWELNAGRPVTLLLTIWIATSVLGFLLLQIIHRLHTLTPRIAIKDYRQIESLLSLLALIKLEAPLPPMRLFAASPDFSRLIVSTILKNKPNVIVELGSGVTTIVVGYFIKKMGQGKLITLEHAKNHVERSQRYLVDHGLQKFVEVLYAPLQDYEINGRNWRWYDISKLEKIGGIDMLIIDGPPGGLQPMARYPAIPLLLDRLNEGAVVFLDDADRQDERKIVHSWLQEFSVLTGEFIETETGAAVIRMREPTK